MKVGGVMLIVLGVLLLTGWWQSIVAVMQGWFPAEGLPL